MKIRQLAARVGFSSDAELGAFFGVSIDEIRAWNISEIPRHVVDTLAEMQRQGFDAEDVSGPRAVGGLHLQ